MTPVKAMRVGVGLYIKKVIRHRTYTFAAMLFTNEKVLEKLLLSFIYNHCFPTVSKIDQRYYGIALSLTYSLTTP